MGLVERALTSLPYTIIDRLLFGEHPAVRPLQVLVQHLIRGPRSAEFLLDGHAFHCWTSEKYFFERENFEQDLWNVLRDRLTRHDVVYDFGAHIGYWVVRLSRICRHVVAFEPSPINFNRLSRNAAQIANATVVNAAIAAKEGEMAFTEAGSMSTIGKGALRVKSVTLDTYARNAISPTFLLIDVEGFAGEALLGAASLLIRRIPLICEIHNVREERSVFDTLCVHGYNIAYVDRTHPYPFRIHAS